MSLTSLQEWSLFGCQILCETCLQEWFFLLLEYIRDMHVPYKSDPFFVTRVCTKYSYPVQEGSSLLSEYIWDMHISYKKDPSCCQRIHGICISFTKRILLVVRVCTNHAYPIQEWSFFMSEFTWNMHIPERKWSFLSLNFVRAMHIPYKNDLYCCQSLCENTDQSLRYISHTRMLSRACKAWSRNTDQSMWKRIPRQKDSFSSQFLERTTPGKKWICELLQIVLSCDVRDHATKD